MRNLQISLHVLLVDCGKHVLIAKIPYHVFCFSLEIWNHLYRLSNSVKEVSVARVFNTHTSCAGAVREHLCKWVLAAVLGNECSVLYQVVNQLT